jgi:hypothetical protein
MANWLQKFQPLIIVDPTDVNQPGAAVVNGEPASNAYGVVVWTALGYADRPMRIDPTGTTVQPVSVVSGGNGSVGPTGSPVPADATYIGALDQSGNLAGLKVNALGELLVTGGGGGGSDVQYNNGTTPTPPITGTAALGVDSGGVVRVLSTDSTGALNITGTISASNPSVGTNNTTAPTSSTQVGVQASDNLVALRTCDTFKTAQVQGGSPLQYGLWTPASGKKYRLMKLWISVSGDANVASGALFTLSFTDGLGGTAIGPAFDVWIQPTPTVDVTGIYPGLAFSTGQIDLGNGVLSGAANTTLYFVVNDLLANGFIRVNVMGTEE